MNKFLKELKIEYNDIELYKRALTHSSVSSLDNERLEFLGDAVLDFVISTFLYTNYSYNEGELTKVRSAIVNKYNLIKLSKKISLDKMIKTNLLRPTDSIIEDAFEAFIAAIYLDLGINKTEKFILNNFKKEIDSIIINMPIDYKTKLQEILYSKGIKNIEYKVINQTGPDHKKEFEIGLYINNIRKAKAKGSSKKTAEKNAAKRLLNEL